MVQPNSVKVQLLSVPDCPLVVQVRSVLNNCLSQTHMEIVVEELVGDYDSPTLLVNGFDVTGRPLAPEGQLSCRLDLPSEGQILAALRGLTVLSCEDKLMTDLQAAALQILLHTSKPASVGQLAAKMNTTSDVISSYIDELLQTGHLRLDSEGLVVGAVGLSLSPTGHEISIDGKRFWAWCAFDVIGIFGALYASGFVKSKDPSSNKILRLEFVKGVPSDGHLMISMADLPNSGSPCHDWCSKVNFFASVSSAQDWIQTSGFQGSLISVGNLFPVAREVWSRFFKV